MEHYRIDFTKSAENDLRNIVRFIASELSAPETAASMAERIEGAISGLSEMPHRYALVSDEQLVRLGYRKLTVKNYIVFYSVNEADEIVRIERILYARQDWQRML